MLLDAEKTAQMWIPGGLKASPPRKELVSEQGDYWDRKNVEKINQKITNLVKL